MLKNCLQTYVKTLITNYILFAGEIVHALNISKPKVIFTCASALRNVLEAKKHVPSLQKVILYGKIKIYNLDTLDNLLRSKKQLNPYDMPILSPDHVAGILCSSGTTGHAKGVELTHENFLTAARHLGYVTILLYLHVFYNYLCRDATSIDFPFI